MYLRRKFIYKAKADRILQKCLALALLLKNKLTGSRLPHYTLNRLSRVAGISYKTAQKYEQKLIEYGFIHFEGPQGKRTMVVNKISSHNSYRNLRVERMNFSSFFSAYRSLQAFIFMNIQHHKDLIRHLLQSRKNPDSFKELKEVRKKMRNFVKEGKLKNMSTEYKEWGISLKRISEDIGCCIRTVQRVVGYAINQKWVKKQNNFEWFYAPHIHYMQIDGFTFSTRHKLCIAHANSYTLSPELSASFSNVMV